MKCNCGYEYSSMYTNDNEQVLIGDEEFIPSKLSITYEREGNWSKILENDTVWICPKCGALKINIDF